MNQQSVHDPAARLTALAAARLLLRTGEAALSPLAQTVSVDLEPRSLSAAIEAAATSLFKDLIWQPHPLARIARGCSLSAFDLDLLGLALLPVHDDRAAAIVGAVAGDNRRRLPAAMGLRLLLGDGPVPSAARAAIWTSPLWRHGLLRLPDPHQPAGDRLLDPSATLLALLDGALPEILPGPCEAVPRPVHPPPDSLAETVRATTAWLEAPDAALLHLAGDSVRGEAVLAAALDGRPLAVFHATASTLEPPWRDLALIALATGGVAALAVPDGGELPMPPADLAAPVVLLAPARTHLRTHPGTRPPARIVLPRPSPVEQAAAWHAAMPLPAVEADALGNQTWMTAADIEALAARAADVDGLAAARLALAPPRPVRMATIRAPEVPWARLVLDDTTAAKLEDLIGRYRLRVPVRFRWKLDHGPLGLVCLLAGDSGVGKTLTAEAIATRLGLPLMRVDLSLVVSKYIGETEKNLSELFAAAEGFAALLFFDEADALFGKRTAVEDAHDRYANIEVNYLLQRLEAFEGIAVLATNMAQGVDEAFLRRFDLSITMPRPGPSQRARLWRAHLPEGRVDRSVDLEAVAERFALTGGEIRNAAVAASYAAATDRPGLVTPTRLHAAINAEFAKKGRPAPGWPTGGSS